MTKHYLLLSLLCISTVVNAQNMGLGTTTPNARLEISASNVVTPTNQDGILIPRVNAFPATNPGSNQNGMMVYLTTTVGANPPGFYYWDNTNTAWKAMGWGLSGNAGTIAGTHFIGTTDNTPFSIRVNNAPGARIDHIKFNTFLGSGAGNIATTGERNVAIGSDAFKPNTTGEKNTTVGGQSLRYNTTGSNNSVYGYDAMYNNGTGSRNTGIGVNALYKNESGNENVGIGLSAGDQNVSGNNNVFIGYQAGYYETGSNKLYIQNSLADANNALIYGEFDNKLLRSNGRMEIFSDNTSNDGLRVIKNYAAGTNLDRVAVFGQNIVDDFYGIGVTGHGGYIGVDGISTGTGTGEYFGVRANSFGGNTGTNYGIYASASGGAVNYAGYFVGNTFVSGNVGIGTLPTSKLTLNGGTGEAFTILGGGDVRIYNDAGTASSLFYASGGTGANNAIFTILSDGKTFTFNGTGGSVSSDARLKQDIVPLTGSLQKLMQLNGYSYRFKTKANIPNKEIGVLAQEVKKVLPEAVFTNDDGMYSVSYNSLVPLLINAVKDQQHIIESQEERIKRLESQVILLLEKNK